MMTQDLHFPNARLLVYNYLLRNQNDCYVAVITAAQDLGLLQGDSTLRSITNGDDVADSCGALRVAKEILNYEIEKKYGDTKESAAKVERIWSEILQKIDSYCSSNISPNSEHNTVNKKDCVQLAPAVLDLVLQYLLPHL